MKSVALAFLFLGISIPGYAAISNLALEANTQTSDETLTTQKIWGLDPSEPNPAQSNWILDRNLDLVGLKTVEVSSGVFKVHADEIIALTTLYFRGPGPWFRGSEEYPCSADPTSLFATKEGAKIAANESAKIWSDLLARDRIKLALILSHISGKSADSVIESAQDLFERWEVAVTADWRVLSTKRAHDSEWSFYRKSYFTGCATRKTLTRPQPEALMEQPPLSASESAFVVRAPARRWDGAYSVRVTLTVDEKRLTGQFLIDSSYPKSVVSPDFLTNQGLYIGAVIIPYAEPERIEKVLARPAQFDQIEISGVVMPINEMLLARTDFYQPPDTMASCCDGVIGNDLLRKYAVRFNHLSTKISEVDFYSREKFRPEGDFIWKAVSLSPSQMHPVSRCLIANADATRVASKWVEWDSVSPEPLRISSRLATAGVNGPVSIYCSGDLIAESIRPSLDSHAGESAVLGADVLDRGDFAFDLGNGRVWLQKSALIQPILQNHTGLELVFDFNANSDDRLLQVASLKQTALSEPLLRAGLKTGTRIISLDGKPADELDSWEVDQRLAGLYGKAVTLGWGIGKAAKSFVLFVK